MRWEEEKMGGVRFRGRRIGEASGVQCGTGDDFVGP
jgi:hypothetical protein